MSGIRSGRTVLTIEVSNPSGAIFHGANRPSHNEAWLWLTALFVLSTIAVRSDAASILSFVYSMLNHNLVYWFAYAVIVRFLLSSNGEKEGPKLKFALLFGVPLMFLTGLSGLKSLDGLVALLFGFLLLKRSNCPSQNAAGIVFLALSANFLWGPIAFAIFKDTIITADAILTEVFLNLQGYDVVRQDYRLGTSEDHRVMIVGSCSSFNNITLAALAAVTALVAVKGKLSRQDLVPLLAVCLVMLCFNTIRLAVFASSYEAYLYWHEGAGAGLLSLISTALVVLSSACIAMPRRFTE